MNSSMPCLRNLTAPSGEATKCSGRYFVDFFFRVVVLDFFLVLKKILPRYFSTSSLILIIWACTLPSRTWKIPQGFISIKMKEPPNNPSVKKRYESSNKMEFVIFSMWHGVSVTLQTEANLQQPHNKSLNTPVSEGKPDMSDISLNKGLRNNQNRILN